MEVHKYICIFRALNQAQSSHRIYVIIRSIRPGLENLHGNEMTLRPSVLTV